MIPITIRMLIRSFLLRLFLSLSMKYSYIEFVTIDNVRSGATMERFPYSYAFTDEISIIAQEKLTSINFFLSYNLNSCFKSFSESLLAIFIIMAGIKTVMTVYNPMLKFSEILTFINMAIAKRKFEIIHMIKYLLSSSFPLLFVDNRIFARSMRIIPMILVKMIFSFRNTKPNITKKTVDSCLSILNVEGAKPYLASMFNLSVAA